MSVLDDLLRALPLVNAAAAEYERSVADAIRALASLGIEATREGSGLVISEAAIERLKGLATFPNPGYTGPVTFMGIPIYAPVPADGEEGQ